MSATQTFSRVIGSISGLLFLLVAALLVVGFGGLATYPLYVRLILAGLVGVYAVIRLRGVLTTGGERRN